MTSLPLGLESNRTSLSLLSSSSARPEITTMPSSNSAIRNPIGGRNLPFPRPTVSLDPRPVVIPILSSVIGFPIVVFALICALRHRAIKLRKRDQLRKLQSGIRSVTLDLPRREKASFYSGCSSPDISLKEAGEKLESMSLKPSLSTASNKKNVRTSNHVTFVTPDSTTMSSSTPTTTSMNVTTVEVLLHVNSANVTNDPKPNGGTCWSQSDQNLPSIQIEGASSCSDLR